MRKIYCIGETVYDIIFRNGKAVESCPGGTVLNTSVSLGRMGEKVYVVGDQANDAIGNIIADFLSDNNVSTKYLTLYNDAKSRVALAFLYDTREPAYSFYKIRVNGEIKITFPEVKRDDIVLFGSFTSIKAEVRDDLMACLRQAKEAGAILIYDPNFRPSHLKDRERALPLIKENLEIADIVKGSNEDFQLIFESNSALDTNEIVKGYGCRNFIYTANKYGVNLFTPDFHKVFDVPRITPVSTVGAGDSFNAGLIYGLIKQNVYASDLENMSLEVWRKVIYCAISFATHVCCSYDNFINDEFISSFDM
ncbi:MAG: carbohydrate kinase [Bacteroidales bacterium]|nr:carbohydrate kinase [Bacteroidales bacterium]